VETAAVEALAPRYGIRLAIQHGSTVSGRARPDSDLDLALLLDRSPSTDQYLSLVADLQSLSPGRDVDLVVLNHADPLLLHRIATHGRLLFGSPSALHAFKIHAFRRFQDHRRFLAMERAYVRRKISDSAP
jgi:predicted nucleotidyltransferase